MFGHPKVLKINAVLDLMPNDVVTIRVCELVACNPEAGTPRSNLEILSAAARTRDTPTPEMTVVHSGCLGACGLGRRINVYYSDTTHAFADKPYDKDGRHVERLPNPVTDLVNNLDYLRK